MQRNYLKQTRGRVASPLNAKKKNNRKNENPLLQLKPSFPGQPVLATKVLSNPQKLTTTVTTGLISSVIALGSANVASFTTRFSGWEEVRIIKAILRLQCCSSTNPGTIIAYVDQDDNTTPTLALAQSHQGIRFSAADVMQTHTLVFRATDPTKLGWLSVSAGIPSVGYFKLYTDNAALASSIVATDYITASVEYSLQFRGFSV
jgi:hypothetical protein